MKDKLMFVLGLALGCVLAEILWLAGVGKGMTVERDRILKWLNRECQHPTIARTCQFIENKEHWERLS